MLFGYNLKKRKGQANFPSLEAELVNYANWTGFWSAVRGPQRAAGGIQVADRGLASGEKMAEEIPF